MEFKANFIKQVKKLLVNRPSRIKLNVSIKEIMKIVEIGTEINGFALFEHKDFRVLEDFATEHFGKDFLISKSFRIVFTDVKVFPVPVAIS